MRILRWIAAATITALLLVAAFRDPPRFGGPNTQREAPISVAKRDDTKVRDVGVRDYGFGLKAPNQETLTQQVFTITATKEKVAIRKVLLNRGNCTSTQVDALIGTNTEEDWSLRPRVLRFGETVELSAYCNVIEASIETNAGNFVFHFER